MIEQELIKLRKDIKRIRRSKKIKVVRTNYITYSIFLSKIYDSCKLVNIKYQNYFNERKDYLREVIARKRIIKFYKFKETEIKNITIKDIKNNNGFCFEIQMFRGFQNNGFKLLEILILEKGISEIKELKVVLFSNNINDKRNGYNNNCVSSLNLHGVKKFKKKLKLYFKSVVKLFDQKFNNDYVVDEKQMITELDKYDSKFKAKTNILHGDKFEIKLYIIC